LPSVPVEIGVEVVEGVIPLPGATLQILPPTGKARGEGVRESTNAEESGRRNYKNPTKNH
jgi:hypothetical protein